MAASTYGVGQLVAAALNAGVARIVVGLGGSATTDSSSPKFVPPEERIEAQSISPGIERIVARYGYMETPTIMAALRAADDQGVEFRAEETVYVVGRENPVLGRGSGMPMAVSPVIAHVQGRHSASLKPRDQREDQDEDDEGQGERDEAEAEAQPA